MDRLVQYEKAFALVGIGTLLFSCALGLGVYNKHLSPAAIVASLAQPEEQAPAPVLSTYIEVLNSCDYAYKGTCVIMRSGPSEESPAVLRLRTGIVLKVADTVSNEGRDWYRIAFDAGIRYPERVSSNWYVAADLVHAVQDSGDQVLEDGMTASSTKRIIVDRTAETLTAYDGDTLFMQEPISTGLDLTPTPRGIFTVYKKTPSRYMQGPLPGISDQYYDLPGVPWNLYFTLQGGVIHGAYWHNSFGQPWSHGCVNLPVDQAKKLYEWADIGTTVIVRD